MTLTKLINGECLFNSLSIFMLLRVEDLPAQLYICGQVVRIKLLENKTGKIALDKYRISLTDIISSSVNTNYGVLLCTRHYLGETVFLPI